MITNIRFTDVVDVSPTSTKEFKLANGEVVGVDTVPAVVYSFHDYFIEQAEFIGKMLDIFDRSLHVAEIRYTGNYSQEIGLLNSFKHVAVFLRIPITDEDVQSGGLTEDKVKALEHIGVDQKLSDGLARVLLEDRTTTLHTESAISLRRTISSLLGVSESIISLCCSPVVLSESEQGCLNALVARKLGAIYGKNESLVIATKAIEEVNENCCKCLRKITISETLVGTEPKAVRKIEKQTKGLGNFMNSPEDTDESEDKENKPIKTKTAKKSEDKPKKVKTKLPKGVLLRY